jgi:hypothetical protein
MHKHDNEYARKKIIYLQQYIHIKNGQNFSSFMFIECCTLWHRVGKWEDHTLEHDNSHLLMCSTY